MGRLFPSNDSKAEEPIPIASSLKWAVSSIPALFAAAMTFSGEEPKPVLQRFFSETKGKSVSSSHQGSLVILFVKLL